MQRPRHLSQIQFDLAEIFFSLAGAEEFLLAGGAALLASDLISRPTQDLDLFAASPIGSVTQIRDDFVKALEERGFAVTIVEDFATFCRMVVSEAKEETLVDIAVDAPPLRTPTVTVLGPTFAPVELAGRKLLALFSRAEARDFADVYVLAERFGEDALIEQAHALDAGFNLEVFVQMLGTLKRFDDQEIPLAIKDVPRMRTYFEEWAARLRSK